MKRLLILCLALLPLVALARKSSRGGTSANAPIRPTLSERETLAFDSLYFEALSLNLQERSADAFERVNGALAIDSLSAPAHFLRSRL